MKSRHLLPPLLLFVFGVIWILTTDELLTGLAGQDLSSYKNLQTVKGLVFVTLIALLGLWSMRYLVRRTDGLVQFYKTLYDQNPYPMWLYDRKTLQFLSANRATLQRYGYTWQELKQMTLRDIRPEEEIGELENRLKNLEDSELENKIWTHRTKSGDYLKVRVHGFPIRYKGKETRLVIVSDVTDIVEAREREAGFVAALRTREAELDAVINNTDDIIWSVDRELRIRVLNESFQDFCNQWFGLKMQVGESAVLASLPEREKAFWSRMYETVFRGSAIMFEREWIASASGDDTLWLAVSMQPIRGENGEVEGVSCYARNVSDYKRNIVTLGKQNEYLKEIAFTSSHELRKPVANILGITDIINRDPDEQAVHKMVGYLQTSATELDGFLRKIVRMTEKI